MRKLTPEINMVGIFDHEDLIFNLFGPLMQTRGFHPHGDLANTEQNTTIFFYYFAALKTYKTQFLTILVVSKCSILGVAKALPGKSGFTGYPTNFWFPKMISFWQVGFSTSSQWSHLLRHLYFNIYERRHILSLATASSAMAGSLPIPWLDSLLNSPVVTWALENSPIPSRGGSMIIIFPNF